MLIRFRSKAGLAIIIYILISYRFFNIVSLPVDNSVLSYGLWMLSVVLYVYFIYGVNRIKAKYKFIRCYFTYILLAQVLVCIYSMIKYNESILDMYLCAGAYLTLLLTYIILLSFEKDGFKYLLDAIYWIVFVNIILVLVHSFICNNVGVALFHFTHLTSKTDNVRIALGPLTGVFVVYAFYNLLKRRRKSMIAALVVGVAGMFYSEMTRANEVAICVTIFMIWLFERKKVGEKNLKYFIAFLMAVVFICSDYFDLILSYFSIDPDLNEAYLSTLARYNAIEYFSEFTKNNPLMGMGWVRPYTEELTRIWSGPTNNFFFDDLGFLGQFFRLGILGSLIYVILVVRMVYVCYKIKDEHEQSSLLVGLTSYAVCTMVSLNMFDGSRILAVPIYIAITEYIYISHRRGFNSVYDMEE